MQSVKCAAKVAVQLKDDSKTQQNTSIPYIVQKKEWAQLIEFMAVAGEGCEVIEARHSKERNQNE